MRYLYPAGAAKHGNSRRAQADPAKRAPSRCSWQVFTHAISAATGLHTAAPSVSQKFSPEPVPPTGSGLFKARRVCDDHLIKMIFCTYRWYLCDPAGAEPGLSHLPHIMCTRHAKSRFKSTQARSVSLKPVAWWSWCDGRPPSKAVLIAGFVSVHEAQAIEVSTEAIATPVDTTFGVFSEFYHGEECMAAGACTRSCCAGIREP